MKLSNSQANVHIGALNRLYNLKLHVFKSLGERTYNSENEKIYYPRFALYAERSSSADAKKSYHLTSFELINK